MSEKPMITKIEPPYAVNTGVVEIFPEKLTIEPRKFRVEFDGVPAELSAAGSKRVLAAVPRGVSGTSSVVLVNGSDKSGEYQYEVGKSYTDTLHNVGNPVVDPQTGDVWVTRSGIRGVQIGNPICRIEEDGYLDELAVVVLNPSGFAFSHTGRLYTTSRAAGEVYRIKNDIEATCVATGLGIPTGIVTGSDGAIYIGDRSGTIYRMEEDGLPEVFATLIPSVAAYHLAFGPDGRLYVSAPGMASYDAIYAIDPDGNVETWLRGFGRPQGLAFSEDGSIFIAAFRGGRRGIFRVSPEKEISLFVAAADAVGLCFDRNGRMLVATRHEIHGLDVGIRGIMLD
jgi:sugar lactone lactonase YvrE